VTVNVPQSGSIQVTDSSGNVLTPNSSNEIKVVLNSILTFTGRPAELYTFKSWTGGTLTGNTNPENFQVTADITVGADFSAPVLCKLTIVQPSSGGSISAVSGGSSVASGNKLPAGSVVALTVTKAADCVLDHWLVNGETVQDAETMNLTLHKNTAGTGGTITPSGSSTVKAGGSIIYGITPSYGYTISDVTVDGKSVGAVSTYQFSNVTENHAISASFAAQSTPGGTGGGVTGGGTAGSKAEYTLTFNTNGGSAIAAITKASGTVVDLSSFKPTRDSFAFAGWYADEDPDQGRHQCRTQGRHHRLCQMELGQSLHRRERGRLFLRRGEMGRRQRRHRRRNAHRLRAGYDLHPRPGRDLPVARGGFPRAQNHRNALYRRAEGQLLLQTRFSGPWRTE
jgi:hypothetical protein